MPSSIANHSIVFAVWPARLSLLLAAFPAFVSLCGCTGSASQTRVEADSPQLAAWIELVMPARIKILEWTKPVSLAADGTPDALEVIVEARDSFDDLTKVVGTFHFELQTRRLSDRMGSRVGFWPVDVTSEKSMRLYRDRFSGFYQFPLQLDEPLRPGRYVLNVWLLLPGGQRLIDEYEFEYDGSAVPSPTSF